MIHDPMRGQMRALIVGVVIAVLITGAAGVLAFFKPVPNFGNSTIMLSKSHGAMFVRIGDRLHPVLNLASARLIAGTNDMPKQVDDKFLSTVPLGPVVGVVGGPNAIHHGDDMTVSSWTVCDSTETPRVTETVGEFAVETTVLANTPVLTDDIRAAGPAQMLLTTAGNSTFLIYNGVRAPIDPTDPVLRSALHLQDAEPRVMTPGLLNAFPLVDPILPVSIPGAGEPTNYLERDHRVGSIVKTTDSRGEQLYAVLREGLQPISEATADVIRYGDVRTETGPSSVSPAVVSEVPIVDVLNVGHYPKAAPEFIRTEPDRVVCMSWQQSNSAAEATTRLLVGHRLPSPNDAQAVRLATADGNGPALDEVYLKPGTGEYIQSTGGERDSRAMGQLFYIADSGVRYHIRDLPTSAALGVRGVRDPDGGPDDVPQAAPWPIIALLPPGPELSQQAALIAHDGMAADPDGMRVTPPQG